MTRHSFWNDDRHYFEYMSAIKPELPPVKALQLLPAFKKPTDLCKFDFSADLQTPYPATSPNCLAAFARIAAGDSLTTTGAASSHFFVVLHGNGTVYCGEGAVEWHQGDILTIPWDRQIVFESETESLLYWVNDEPLFNRLQALPQRPAFSPTIYPYNELKTAADKYNAQSNAARRNRNGVIPVHPEYLQTRSATPVLWTLFNIIQPGQIQPAHRHNSVALDLCTQGSKDGKVYTLMSERVDKNGNLIDPLKICWEPETAFITPPGWWHEHHNDSNTPAVVVPVQDAGLYIYQRTLFIEFASEFSK
ncbi:cupin [Lentisphaerota bacterium ZTH]|nr:cupin [Lentisphaerota bacterium]WET07337.1 cupin [Lentisphaerota bacterium ZTH]